MTKVIAFGTFDILHPGHEHVLREAKKLGDNLVVVLSRDKTVLEVKKHRPLNDENIRKENLAKLQIADKIILGSEEQDKYQVIRSEKPDIIALGYDQIFFTKDLDKEFADKIKIVRLKPFHEKEFKTSIIRKRLEENK